MKSAWANRLFAKIKSEEETGIFDASNVESGFPLALSSAEPHPKYPLESGNPRTWMLGFESDKLLAQRWVFQNKVLFGLKSCPKSHKQREQT